MAHPSPDETRVYLRTLVGGDARLDGSIFDKIEAAFNRATDQQERDYLLELAGLRASRPTKREPAVALDPENDGRDCPALVAQPAGHGFKLTLATEIFADLPEQDWTVDGIIRAGSVCLLGAYGSSGKTWFAIDLMLSVACGVRWLGRFDCKQGAVVFMDLESGDYELRRRIQQVWLARHDEMNSSGVANDALALCTMPNISMAAQPFEERMRALATGRKLIIFDSLAAFNAGLDENTSAMREGLDKLRKVAEETGCAFVILHHTKKTPSKGEIDAREMFRGSSAIFDAVDSAIFFTVKPGEPLHVEQAKNRHGQKFQPFDASIVDLASGATIVSAQDRERDDAVKSMSKQTPAELSASILRYLESNPGCSQTMIENNVGGNHKSVRAVLEGLEFKGIAEQKKSHGRGWPGYYLKSSITDD